MSEANIDRSEKNFVPFTSLEENINSATKAIPIEAKEKDIDWHKLAHKLREHNRKLFKQVFQLEQALIESNQALEEQKEISQRQDLFAAKQAEKINHYQEELDSILQKIEFDEKANLSQTTVVETLTKELETSQKKAEILAAQCTKLLADNDNKNHELQETKQKLQELSIRYKRQQQNLLNPKPKDNKKVGSQPIKAWSADSTVSPTASTATNSVKNSDWPAPAIAKTSKQIESIAAVQLPKFTRQVEGE